MNTQPPTEEQVRNFIKRVTIEIHVMILRLKELDVATQNVGRPKEKENDSFDLAIFTVESLEKELLSKVTGPQIITATSLPKEKLH